MNKNLLKSAAVYAGIGAFVLVGFQNCAKVAFTDSAAGGANSPAGDLTGVNPSNNAAITLIPNAASVPEGQNVLVTVNYQNVTDVSYTCKDRVSGQVVLSGQVTSSGQQVPVQISQDVHCEATGTATTDKAPLSAAGDVAVDCGNRLKNSAANRCEDFSCKKVVEIDKTQLSNIPERTIEGLCYAVKIFNHIDNAPSDSSKQDGDVISRNHDIKSNNVNDIHHAYILGKDNIEFRLQGPRAVKLSGGLSATAPILVDNFVLVGVYPSSVDPSANLNQYYRAMGTSDSTIGDGKGQDTHAIEFINTLIPLQSFGDKGTSTVAPLDITGSVQAGIYHKIDLRALDCGGAQELSDIYLLFQ